MNITEMVSGDAGGNPESIASGKNSGVAVSPGPKTLGKKVKRMKPMTLKEFISDLKEQEKRKLDEAEAQKLANEESERNVVVTRIKSTGMNYVVIEHTAMGVRDVSVCGSDAKSKLDSDAIKTVFEAEGLDATLQSIRDASGMPWKVV